MISSVINQIMKLLKVDLRLLFLSTFGVLASSLAWFLSILLSSILIKASIDYASQNENSILTFTIIIVISIILLRFPLIIGTAVNSWASEKLSTILQSSIVKKWIGRDLSKESHYDTGEIMTILLNDCADKISVFYYQGLGLKIIEPIITGIAALVVVGMINKSFILISLIFGIFSILLSLTLSRKIEKYHRIERNANSLLSNSFTDYMRNMISIKTLNLKTERAESYMIYNKMVMESAYKIEKYEAVLNNLVLLMNLSVVIVCFIVGVKLRGFEFTNIVVILQMQFFINNMLSNIGNMWNYLLKTSISSERIFEIIEDIKQMDNKEELVLDKVQSLFIDHLSYSYGDNLVLNSISMNIKMGNLIVIFGESGEGKSTLFNILQGFLQDYSGKVFINNIEFEKISIKEIFRNVKLFEQDPVLFNVSVRENIQINNKRKTSDINLKSYAEKVGLSSLNQYKAGFNTIINEDSKNISGGEKQKIALMRLFMIESPIVLLDEPTAAMDVKSETIICETLSELKDDKIILVNTHRAKVLEIADCIYVLHNGKFIETGSHLKLMEKKGFYFDQYMKKVNE